MYKFKIDKTFEPITNIKQYWGYAQREENAGTKFFLTTSVLITALTVEPTEEGKKLITYFTELLGEPTLNYKVKHPEIKINDYTAEWLVKYPEIVAARIQQHLSMGFTSEELT